MSTLVTATVKSNSSSPIAFQNSSGTEVGRMCRAWVNFNGTGTVAIRAQFNVSSITDNGTGDYTVNFTTALADANYSAVTTTTSLSTTGDTRFNCGIRGSVAGGASNKSTTALRIFSGYNYATAGFDDCAELNVAIFR